MKPLPQFVMLTVLCACGPEQLDGFTVLPELPTAPAQLGPSLQVAADGTVWMAYLEDQGAGNYATRPASLDEGGWRLGTALDREGGVLLGLVDGAPTVQVGNASRVDLMHFRDGAWQAGTFFDLVSLGGSTWSSLRLAGDGGLLVGYEVSATDQRVALQAPGAALAQLGGNLLTPDEEPFVGQSTVEAAFAPSGAPVAAYVGYSGDQRVARVQRWDGTRWQTVSADLPIQETFFVLHVDSQERYWWVSTTYAGSGNVVAVHRWDGMAWQSLGESGVATQTDSFVSVLDAEDRLVVAEVRMTREGPELVLRRLGSDGWETLGTIARDDAWISGPAVAVDPDGAPVLAWTESAEGAFPGPGNTRVRVARYTGQP